MVRSVSSSGQSRYGKREPITHKGIIGSDSDKFRDFKSIDQYIKARGIGLLVNNHGVLTRLEESSVPGRCSSCNGTTRSSPPECVEAVSQFYLVLIPGIGVFGGFMLKGHISAVKHMRFSLPFGRFSDVYGEGPDRLTCQRAGVISSGDGKGIGYITHLIVVGRPTHFTTSMLGGSVVVGKRGSSDTGVPGYPNSISGIHIVGGDGHTDGLPGTGIVYEGSTDGGRCITWTGHNDNLHVTPCSTNDLHGSVDQSPFFYFDYYNGYLIDLDRTEK